MIHSVIFLSGSGTDNRKNLVPKMADNRRALSVGSLAAAAATALFAALALSFGRVHTLEFGLDWDHLTQRFFFFSFCDL